MLACAHQVWRAVQARKRSGAAAAAQLVAASMAGEGYNSDEDVYATAKAVDAGLGVEYDSDDNPIVAAAERRDIGPLPPLDHSEIEYDSFAKDFYSEAAAIKGMSDAEVGPCRDSLMYACAGVRVLNVLGRAADARSWVRRKAASW